MSKIGSVGSSPAPVSIPENSTAVATESKATSEAANNLLAVQHHD